MKKLIFTALTALFLLPFSGNIPVEAQNVTRKLLVTLQPDEKIMMAESCLALLALENKVFLITTVGNNYFVYENGQRKGPFSKFEEIEVKAWPEDSPKRENNCSVYETAEESYNPDLLVANDDGTFSIKLNGKVYGPYGYITRIHAWSDNSGFVALTMDKQMKLRLVTSDGLDIPLNGEVEKIQFSPVSKKFVFALKEKQEVDPDFLKVDYSKMTQEEILKFAQKMEEKAKNAPPLKSYIYVNGTTKLGPYDLNAFYSNNPAFTKTSGDNWIMIMDDVLYVNGGKVKEFPNTGISTCQTWLSKDGKKYVVVTYDKITFSDGKVYEYPIEPSVSEKDGKITVKWAALENEKDLVFYSREL